MSCILSYDHIQVNIFMHYVRQIATSFRSLVQDSAPDDIPKPPKLPSDLPKILSPSELVSIATYLVQHGASLEKTDLTGVCPINIVNDDMMRKNLAQMAVSRARGKTNRPQENGLPMLQ